MQGAVKLHRLILTVTIFYSDIAQNLTVEYPRTQWLWMLHCSLVLRTVIVSMWMWMWMQHSRLKVKGPNIYIPPLTWKLEQRRFTKQSGILDSISSRRRRAISSRPLSECSDFGPAACS